MRSGFNRPTVVFFHAHPDDEAIFTGGTIASLAASGVRVVVVFATSGQFGVANGPGLGWRRRREAESSCRILGAERLVMLDHVDSGYNRDRRDRPWGAFADVEIDVVADHLATILAGERAEALVTYDQRGIYGHPDHVQAHLVGARARFLAGTPTLYEVTVDCEQLHYVDTHLVGLAVGAPPSSGVYGLPTVEITTTVDVRARLYLKRRAMEAHESQLNVSLPEEPAFSEVYGHEWYVRTGPESAIEQLVEAPAALDSRAATSV